MIKTWLISCFIREILNSLLKHSFVFFFFFINFPNLSITFINCANWLRRYISLRVLYDVKIKEKKNCVTKSMCLFNN